MRPTQGEIVVYCHVVIWQMSDIRPAHSSFKCRFDLFVHWDSEIAEAHGSEEQVHVKKEDLGWIPIIRFPNADEVSNLPLPLSP